MCVRAQLKTDSFLMRLLVLLIFLLWVLALLGACHFSLDVGCCRLDMDVNPCGSPQDGLEAAVLPQDLELRNLSPNKQCSITQLFVEKLSTVQVAKWLQATLLPHLFSLELESWEFCIVDLLAE